MMKRYLTSTRTGLVMLALVVTVGCSIGKKGPATSSTPRTGNSPAPPMKYPPRVTVAFVPSAEPKKDLDDAIKRLETAYPYRVTFSQRSGERPTVQFVVEYAAANRFHLRDSSDGDSFVFGDTTYSRFPNLRGGSREWSTETSESIGKKQERTVQTNLPRTSRNVKSIGKETLNGVECYVFEIGRAYSDAKAWIGAVDGLLYQIDDVSKDLKQHYRFEYVDVQVDSPMP